MIKSISRSKNFLANTDDEFKEEYVYYISDIDGKTSIIKENNVFLSKEDATDAFIEENKDRFFN